MQQTLQNLSSTITEAYHHNWVIKLTLSRSQAVTGMVNTSPSHGVFYLTHNGDIEKFELGDLNDVTVIEKKWWKL
ncbi:hypothetical protein ACFP1H_10665 [Secundilactobacillus hailunensis]|jgi:hypothetical protein|uniref:Uncharacterized protein n=2 Tax=Secundilactobacillus TaxID=2767892 RepID=A0A1Z5H3D7_9LACO|nr:MULTISPECIES: hypothetical protein [Secundilactobacillus]TDG70402.1 hypothetical protein C5L25_001592 [Secundilactobacillus silagei JCM 19001]GAT17826.1 hypothetical protein IWT126_00082 [Secundilactobacillus silagei JCM 19001]